MAKDDQNDDMRELGMTRESALKWYTDIEADRDVLERWAQGRPSKVRDMIASTPPFTMYRVKAGAPYRFTSPGSIVCVLGYNENGNVKVGVVKLGEGESTYVRASIAPQWLEPVTVDEAFPVEA